MTNQTVQIQISWLLKIFLGAGKVGWDGGMGFAALSRIFHLYRDDRSSKVGENLRTRGKTPELGFPTCDPSEARTTAVRNLMD